MRAAVYAHTRYQAFDFLAADMVAGGSGSLRAVASVALSRLGGARVALALAARVSPGADVFMFARTAVADDAIRGALMANPETQIVILGAGLDTSGLRIGTERHVAGLAPGVFFEVDLPTTQGEKRRQADRLVRQRPELRSTHIRYVACSFGEGELGDRLRAAGFQTQRPTIWIWSGVVHYLTDVSVRATVAELRALSTRGSSLFFDFILLEAYRYPAAYGFKRTKARFDAFGEVMTFGFHEGRTHVGEWLRDQGLEMMRVYTAEDMVTMYEERTRTKALSAGPRWANLCLAQF